MKNTIIILLSIFMGNASAQNSIKVSGVFKENYRTIRLSQEVKRMLFIKTKGNFALSIYGNGYYLKLNSADALKTGFDDVAVIPMFEGIQADDTKIVTLELVQLSKNEPSVFYTKETDLAKRVNYPKNIFIKPSLKDTLDWNDFSTDVIPDTKQWIANLDNEKQVTLRSYILYESDNGGGSSPFYEKKSMRELAKLRLHYVSNLFDEIKKEWTKKQWEDWYQKTISYEEPLLKDCTPNNYRVESAFKYDEGNTKLYGKDEATGRVLAIESLRYNVDYYTGRQIITIDSLKTQQYDYYKEGQQEAYLINCFESVDNSLYFLDYYLNWSRFKYEDSKNDYLFKEKKKRDLPANLDAKDIPRLTYTQSNGDFIYGIIQNSVSKKLFATAIKTKTGEVVQTKSFDEIFEHSILSSLKNMEVVNIKQGQKNFDGFIFALRQGDNYYLVKTNNQFADAKVIKTTKAIDQSTLFVTEKTIDILKTDDDFLLRMAFDKELSKLVFQKQIKIADWYYDEKGIIEHDGTHYKLFAPYRLSLHSGINLLTLNGDLEILKKQCVFMSLPLEEPGNENMIHLKYAIKMNNKWWVLFRKENTLHYATVD